MGQVLSSTDIDTSLVANAAKLVDYLKAHQPLLNDAHFKYHEHLTFAGMAQPFPMA